MKYKWLPTRETMLKVIQVSFSSPKKNLDAYRLYSALSEHYGYLMNEKNKLLEKYGTQDEAKTGKYTLTGDNIAKYNAELSEIRDMDIEADIPDPGITESDFEEDNCTYPSEKALWPSAADIAQLLEFLDVLRKEKSGD